MPYIDYAYYTANGGTADSAAFSLLEYRAEKIVDRYTQQRVQKMAVVPEAAKRLILSGNAARILGGSPNGRCFK